MQVGLNKGGTLGSRVQRGGKRWKMASFSGTGRVHFTPQTVQKGCEAESELSQKRAEARGLKGATGFHQ